MMNKMKHILLFLPVAMLLAACTQNELTDNGQGTPLPEPIPLQLTATGLQAVAIPAHASTRGTYDGDWKGVQTVKVYIHPNSKDYEVSPLKEDSKKAELICGLHPADHMFWWNYQQEEKNVLAWAPSDYVLNDPISLPTKWTKDEFAKYDIIGMVKTISFEERNDPVEFKHLMAKAVINIKKSPYLENSKLAVKMCNLINSGKLTGNSIPPQKNYLEITTGTEVADAVVTPYELESPKDPATNFATYEALVIPQTIAGLDSKIEIKVNDKTTYVWSISFSGNTFAAGNEYTFNITVDAKGLGVQVDGGIEWGTGGASGSGSVTLP